MEDFHYKYEKEKKSFQQLLRASIKNNISKIKSTQNPPIINASAKAFSTSFEGALFSASSPQLKMEMLT